MILEEVGRLADDLGLLAEGFFPGREHVFELVIAPRLDHVVAELFRPRAVNA